MRGLGNRIERYHCFSTTIQQFPQSSPLGPVIFEYSRAEPDFRGVFNKEPFVHPHDPVERVKLLFEPYGMLGRFPIFQAIIVGQRGEALAI